MSLFLLNYSFSNISVRMSKAFPLVCVLQPAMILAYVSTTSIPYAFQMLSETVAGTLLGVSSVLFALIRFYQFAATSTSDLDRPLLKSETRQGYVVHDLELSLSVFSVTTLIVFAAMQGRISDMVILSIVLSTCFATKRPLFPAAAGGIVVGIVMHLVNIFRDYSGEIHAISSGILFQIVASQCLPLWDFASQSKMGFRISSFALVSLYIAASSLQSLA